MWSRLDVAYKALGTPVGERVPQQRVLKLFEHSRTKDPNAFPFMGCKGAQGRHAVPAALHVCEEIAGHLPGFGHVLLCLRGLSLFYDAVFPHGAFLPSAAAAAAKAAIEQYGLHYQWLCHHNMMAGRLLFHMTEKSHHYPIHIGLLCKFFNPKAGWTYKDEDFMHKVSMLVSSSIRGLGPTRVGGAFVFRYLVRLYLRYNRRR